MRILVSKSDGSQEVFRPHKLRQSLRKAGANKDEIAQITKHVEGELYDGIKTQEIFSHAFKVLRESKVPVAAIYSLQRALFKLGPTGFPFEDFLTRLFRAEGYQTRTRITLKGKCAVHELDVGAFNDVHSFVIEAKFHSRPGLKSDLKVVLYSYARMLDLKDQSICNADNCGIKELLLVTNTRFTSTALRYAKCVGLKLLSWEYPKNNTLHERIKKSGLYPVTVLQELSQKQKKTLIERGAILCRDIVEKPQLLRHIHISTRKTEAVLYEARQLCKVG